MRISLKQLLGLVAIAAVLSLVAAWLLQSRALDFWAYGKLGVSDGTPESAVYYLEVRGVGTRPTVTRVVRFADHSSAPRNALAISHEVASELDSHTQDKDRWNQQCMLIAGRTNDEKILIPIDTNIAQKLFTRPGTQFDNYDTLEELWTDHIASHLPPDG